MGVPQTGATRKLQRGGARHDQPRAPEQLALFTPPARRRRAYRAIRWATLTAAAHEGFRIIHISIQRTHVHNRSPRQARRALAYVLSNWREHGDDRRGLAPSWLVDPFSTGILFPDWAERSDEPLLRPLRATYDPLIVDRPRTWLLTEGWKRAGTVPYRGALSAAATT